VLRTNLRIGQPAPDFIFEMTTAHQATLRKLAGTPVILVFWVSASQPSIDEVKTLQATSPASRKPVVIAINDGDPLELANRTAKAGNLHAIIVLDPRRSISNAYGIRAWPTTVFIDSRGLVSAIHQPSTEQSRNSGRQD